MAVEWGKGASARTLGIGGVLLTTARFCWPCAVTTVWRVTVSTLRFPYRIMSIWECCLSWLVSATVSLRVTELHPSCVLLPQANVNVERSCREMRRRLPCLQEEEGQIEWQKQGEGAGKKEREEEEEEKSKKWREDKNGSLQHVLQGHAPLGPMALGHTALDHAAL